VRSLIKPPRITACRLEIDDVWAARFERVGFEEVKPVSPPWAER